MEQYIAVGIIVTASVAYMLKKLVFKPKNTNAACNGCNRCDGRKSRQCH